MQNRTQANGELFRRRPDESFGSLLNSCDRWQLPQSLVAMPHEDQLRLAAGNDGEFLMNDWSFSQLCNLARVSKDTVNALSPETAGRVFPKTLPSGKKPLQILTTQAMTRYIHGATNTRLWNTELLQIVQEFAVDFTPPQHAASGGTGLYAGEQDLFCFLIDPTGWAEIGNEAFAPGVFVWNSEVGKRTVGISTFWFQAVCANHIVWDAVEVTDVSSKHTVKVHDALGEIRRTLEQLVARQDERRDGFVKLIQKAMTERLGTSEDEVLKLLANS